MVRFLAVAVPVRSESVIVERVLDQLRQDREP